MEIQNIPISVIHPSPMNPRKTFAEEDINELADNIAKQGLLQPITVRVFGNGDFEIVCGERRYRAMSKLNAANPAEYPTIAAIVREMTDAEAFDAMITENLQRKDVDPMEEAFAFGQLIKLGNTAEEIALRFGKSIRFVNDRIKLNSLIPELMVAVKDEKMSIAAAMLISKLDEDAQKKYYKSYKDHYQGMTKATAEGFVNGYFMTISSAPWYKGEDKDFAGGCNCKCAECVMNTANQGCLFWDMKPQEVGRCTDRKKFQAKTLAYMVKALDDNADKLVKAGEPLEYDKIVITLSLEEYCGENAKAIKAAFKAEAEKRGYEIINPTKAFNGKYWYGNDKDKVAKALKAGEIYQVLAVTGYDVPEIQKCYYNISKGDVAVQGSNGRPAKVNDLLRDYRAKKTLLPSTKIVSGCKTLAEHGRIDHLKGLDNAEFTLAYSLMVQNNTKLCRALGLGNFPNHDEITEYVSTHPDKVPYIIRAWIRHALDVGTQIVTTNEVYTLAKPLIGRIAESWCPDEYAGAMKKAEEKHEKAIKKIARELKKLGYDLKGNKIDETSEK